MNTDELVLSARISGDDLIKWNLAKKVVSQDGLLDISASDVVKYLLRVTELTEQITNGKEQMQHA